MRRSLVALIALVASLGFASPVAAQQTEPFSVSFGGSSDFDYWSYNREMIRHGQQAVMMCNGLFTSNRTLDQVFDRELAFLPEPVGTAAGGDYVVDSDLRAVAIGGTEGMPMIRAVFREGLGCVVMAPDQDFDDIADLPELAMAPPPGDPSAIPWPNGDLVEDDGLPATIDPGALQAASDWAFDRESEQQVTVGLLVVHDGRIVHERYADGFDRSTRTRTWSVAKSLASTLIGMNVDAGRMALDDPLPFDWLPSGRGSVQDPRAEITLRHVLNMSSGLYTVDNAGLEYATGSGMSYWAGASSVTGARSRGLIRQPGTSFDYENYDTLLAIYAMKLGLGDESTYLEFPRRALLDQIGMRNTLIGVDRFGDFVLSSQVYANSRDLARLGLLYLQGGVWDGERLLSEEWIEFVRTPGPASSQYGGHFWLVPEGRTDVPADAYSMVGNRGQYVIIVPSHDLVIVRRGLDYGRQGFDRWGLLQAVVKAVR